MSIYEEVKKEYAKIGVDTDKAIETLKEIPISIHYIGRARNFEELKKDIVKAFSYMPGTMKLNIHACYAILGEDLGKVDRDKYLPKHFAPWVQFAKENGIKGIDFNPTCFSHPMVKNGLTLSSPDKNAREFWINHCKACIKISEYFAEEMGEPTMMNILIPDGLKDVPADRLTPRLRLKESLDENLKTKYDKKKVYIGVESKVFGIGVESYTTGNNEFYQNYAAKNNICCLLDNGHYHPTEVVSDKIPALLPFYDTIALHVTRGIRWDSDHVVLFEDELKEIAKEIVRNNAIDKVKIGLDYFDASINRLSAWITGQRAMQEALLFALLLPNEELRELQDEGNFTKLMARQEECKMMPYGVVWKEYLSRQGLGSDYYAEIKKYEDEVLSLR